MKLLLIFISFILIEYVLRTCIDPFKFHLLRPSLDFLPVVLLTIASAIYYRDVISRGHFGSTFLKLFFVSFAALIVIKTILFLQWYWIIAPEYRKVEGDMMLGLGFAIANLLVSAILLACFYLFSCLVIKCLSKKHLAKRQVD